MKSFINVKNNMVVAQHNDDFVGFYPDCVMITTKIEG